MPPLADDRFVVTTEYRPGVQALEVGGDWYDAFLVEDGVLAVVVGDVVGRGLHAATAMGQLRSAVRALAEPGVGPARLLSRLDRFVEQTGAGFMATTAYAEVALATGAVRVSRARVTCRRCCSAPGGPTFLWEGRSTPLGLPGRPRPEATASLRAGRPARPLHGRPGRAPGPAARRRARRARTQALAGGAAGRCADLVSDLLLHTGDDRDDVCVLVLDWHG